jgi:hypothetical protein
MAALFVAVMRAAGTDGLVGWRCRRSKADT